jgi:hypothetical protein
MALSNVTQEGGQVMKGLAIIGFSLNSKECSDDAAGDLRMMGYSLFYKNCQEVDMVSKLIFLGVPNSIEKEVIKGTLEEELASLESTLLVTDRDYKLIKTQQENWIKYTVIKEFQQGCPGRMQRRRRKSKETTMQGLGTSYRCISLTTNISRIFVNLQSNARCGINIGAMQHSQLRYWRVRANKGRRQDMYKWFRHMARCN